MTVRARRTTASSRHRLAAAWTTGAATIAAVVVGLLRDAAGPPSVLIALAMVLAFGWAATLPFAVAGDGKNGKAFLGFVVLGTTYALRLLLALVVLAVASSTNLVEVRVIGVSVIGLALVWTSVHVVLGLSRKHQPFLDA